MLACGATSGKRDWESKRRRKAKRWETVLAKERVKWMRIRVKECWRLERKKSEWRGGRVCVWHESVCLCHTGSGLFSPLLRPGDANPGRSPNVNLAFTPTCISTQFCLIQTRRWKTVRVRLYDSEGIRSGLGREKKGWRGNGEESERGKSYEKFTLLW